MKGWGRRPPRTMIAKAPPGTCVWCGGALPKGRRSWCSDDCVTEYRVANFQGDARRHLFARDRGICAACGTDPADSMRFVINHNRLGLPSPDGYRYTPLRREPGAWIADHIVPLWSVDRDAPDAFRFWTLANLQTLCVPCSNAKTAREAGERAAIRRGVVRAAAPQADLFA